MRWYTSFHSIYGGGNALQTSTVCLVSCEFISLLSRRCVVTHDKGEARTPVINEQLNSTGLLCQLPELCELNCRMSPSIINFHSSACCWLNSKLHDAISRETYSNKLSSASSRKSRCLWSNKNNIFAHAFGTAQRPCKQLSRNYYFRTVKTCLLVMNWWM